MLRRRVKRTQHRRIRLFSRPTRKRRQSRKLRLTRNRICGPRRVRLLQCTNQTGRLRQNLLSTRLRRNTRLRQHIQSRNLRRSMNRTRLRHRSRNTKPRPLTQRLLRTRRQLPTSVSRRSNWMRLPVLARARDAQGWAAGVRRYQGLKGLRAAAYLRVRRCAGNANWRQCCFSAARWGKRSMQRIMAAASTPEAV
jgi:hypothetical protein